MCAAVVIMMIVCSLFSRCSPLTAVEMSQRKNAESKKILHNALLLNTVNARRHVRSLTDPRQNCGKWSQWIDDHHPTLQDKGDREFMPADKLDEFCSSTYGGHISKMMCRDEKGEPTFGNSTYYGKIFVFCSDVNVGVTCSMVQQSIDYICPDMAVRYFCNCTPTTTVQPLIVTPSVMQRMSTQSSSILTSGSTEIFTDPRFRTTAIGLSVSSGSMDSNNKMENNTSVEEKKMTEAGTLSVTWWIIVLVISGSLFVIIVVSVCLRYKWAVATRARQTKVQPIESHV